MARMLCLLFGCITGLAGALLLSVFIWGSLLGGGSQPPVLSAAMTLLLLAAGLLGYWRLGMGRRAGA